ncbi:MAG: Hpt domain-containing protein [Sulfurovum sp.]|nr:Hpt domain-containing protein [Sulfurovum sp.]
MITSILVIFVLIIILIVYKEYKNDKVYKKKRNEKTSSEDYESSYKSQSVSSEDTSTLAKKKNEISQNNDNLASSINTDANIKYPEFTHKRLLDMGFTTNEAKEFVSELITQIETQIPLIEEAIHLSNLSQIERLTHHIKGSASNIGTGGVSDLLVAYNIYLKKGTDISIVQSYFQDLIHYTNKLKSQYA